MLTFASFRGMGGPTREAPHLRLLKKNMLELKALREIVDEWLQETDYFLVDIREEEGDHLVVEIDHQDGVWIDDCADLSRYIQDRLPELADEWELEVGSAGIGQPFKVEQQYINNIGKPVEVMTLDGKKLKGTLTAVSGRRFSLLVKEKQQVEGRKRPQTVEVEKTFDMDGIKYTKYLIIFK